MKREVIKLFTIVGKIKKVYEDGGFHGLIKATTGFLHDVLLYYILRIKREDFAKMEYFVPGDAEDAFNFISEEFFGVFKPQQKESEFLELLKVFEKTKPHNIMEIGTYRGEVYFAFVN